jgi:hypothetical protein
MKMTIETDNRLEALAALNADEIGAAVHDAQEDLRALLKHDDGIPESTRRQLEGIRALLLSVLTLMRYE